MRIKGIVWLGTRTERFAEMRDFIARITGRALWIDRHDFAVFEPPAPECAGESPRRPRGSGLGSSAFISDMALAAFERDLRRSGIVLRSPDALRRIATAPGELGFARAYVAGDLDIEGDVYEALALLERRRASPISSASSSRSRAILGSLPFAPCLLRPRRRLRGRRHSKARDAAAIAHHYDVSNRFYRLVLGPSMTYSCALSPTRRQRSRRRRRRSTSSLPRSSGCARGCASSTSAAGGAACSSTRPSVTASRGSASPSRAARPSSRAHACWRRVSPIGSRSGSRTTGMSQTARTTLSSIGMFEHVGLSQLDLYFRRLRTLLRPGGLLLNHGIGRPPGRRPLLPRRTFVNRYVFPDGELHEVGAVVSRIQAAGFEVRHLESLREHYPLTLRRWVQNLEDSWDEAVAEAERAGAHLAPVHGRLRARVRRDAFRCTRCSRSGPTAARACRSDQPPGVEVDGARRRAAATDRPGVGAKRRSQRVFVTLWSARASR